MKVGPKVITPPIVLELDGDEALDLMRACRFIYGYREILRLRGIASKEIGTIAQIGAHLEHALSYPPTIAYPIPNEMEPR